jgi:hypothetical protein
MLAALSLDTHVGAIRTVEIAPGADRCKGPAPQCVCYPLYKRLDVILARLLLRAPTEGILLRRGSRQLLARSPHRAVVDLQEVLARGRAIACEGRKVALVTAVLGGDARRVRQVAVWRGEGRVIKEVAPQGDEEADERAGEDVGGVVPVVARPRDGDQRGAEQRGEGDPMSRSAVSVPRCRQRTMT